MKKIAFLFLLMVTAVWACKEDSPENLDAELSDIMSQMSPTGSQDHFILADADDLANLPNQEPKNPITRKKVELGRLLYFEPGLAQNPKRDTSYETYSCSSCHVPERGFLPGRRQGIADGAIGFGDFGSTRLKIDSYAGDELDAQGTRPLTSLNVAYMTNTLWSGLFGATHVNEGTEKSWTGLAEVNHTGYMGLEAQNIEGFDLHRLEINDHVLDDFGYRELFDEAFSDYDVEDRYTPETASFAMGAFIRTLITNKAPFQDYLKGDQEAITASQKKGALLFFGKAKCVTCHNGPSFSAMDFYALGTKDMYELNVFNTGPRDERNYGRGMFTGKSKDLFKFKVPQLYNLKDYTHFFHGSSKTSIYEVLDFKVKAQSENRFVPQRDVANKFRPIDLSNEEIEHLADFLLNALYDDDVQRFVPEKVLSGYCFPNNDWLSREDTDCD